MTQEMEACMNTGAQIESDAPYKLSIIQDADTVGYQIYDMASDELVIEGYDFESQEDMFRSLSELNDALKCIFG